MIFVYNDSKWIPVDVDAHVVSELSGLKTCDFQISIDDPNYAYFKNEVSVLVDGLYYKVKCDASEDENTETIECYLDRDDFKATMWNKSFYSGSVTLSNCVSQILPLGWTHTDTSFVTDVHTIDETENDVNALEILEDIANAYGVVFEFDNANKILTSILPENTGYKGFYIINDLNTAGITYTADTYEFCTRIYGYGAYVEITDSEGNVTGGHYVTFADINDGKEYVEDKTYANATISKTIRDERFTDASSLLAYCQSELEKCAYPQISYEIVTVNLAKLDPDKYNLFAYQMHDLVKYIDKRRGIEVYERIVQYEYTQNHPELDVITLSQISIDVTDANKSLTATITSEAQKATSAANNYAGVQLNLAKATIYNLVVSKLEADYIDADTIDATYATITNLNAQKARIDTIESDNVTINNKLTAAEADITTLTADTATINGKITAAEGRIGDLEADHVSTTDLQASNARIGTLEADNATINGKLTAAEGDIASLEAKTAVIDTLDTTYAQIDLANVNNAWIQNGIIKDAAISDAQIIGVSANKLTAGTIDASNITVTNLNASNITTGTLNGQRIGTGSLSLDKLSEDVYTEAEVDAKLATMQDEIDGAIETFTGSVVPTLNNYPASSWSDADTRSKHVGDVYYVVNTGNQADGYCYRFAYDNSTSTYSWVLIKDSDVTAALQRLIDAEGDIDGLQSFESETSAWITDTDEELSSLKTNHTSLTTVVNKTLVSTTQLWYTKANTTAPNKPTAHVTSTSTDGNAWRTVVPAYNSSYPNYFYCYEWQYADGTYGWSDVTRDIGMGETQSTARTASSNASTALTNANSAVSTANTANTNAQAAQNTANANIKSTVQLWFTKANTTAPSKPTAHVTTNNASTANEWNIAVPTYNATYPNYFYCYEYQKGDNTYSWSDVVLDRATTENQANARSALSQVATKVETSVFNTVSQQVDTNTANITSLSNTVETKADGSTVTTLSNTVNSVQQTANSNTSKISNLTTRLGTNADGTEGTNDIVAKEAALEQDLSGFKTTVSSTYATQANLNTEINQRKAMYGTSSTAVGTTAKAVTCANFALYTGARVAVTFSNANTATVPTLNVNSTGAKTIKSFSGAALTEAEYKWAAGSTLEFIYDGTNWRLADEGTLKRLNAAEGTLSTHSTTIEQNTNAIALKANATDVYTKTQTDGLISTEVTNRNAAIELTAEGINTEVAKKVGASEIISKINQSPESVTINADRVNIEGAAIFSSGRLSTTSLNNAIDASREMHDFTIDLSGSAYDDTTWYPVVIQPAKAGGITHLTMDFINGGGTPSWSIHSTKNWAATVDVTYNPSRWGWRSDTQSYMDMYAFGQVLSGLSPVTFSNALSNSDRLVMFARGGAVYPVRINTTITPTVYTETYQHDSYQSVSPTTTQPVNTSNFVKTRRDTQTDITAVKSTADAAAPKANAVKRTQRIWYRKSESGAPSTPGTASSNWVIKADDGDNEWTKMHVAISSSAKYIYTCEQYEMADGTVGYTSVLLDNTITVIDGGNIITGTVTANALNASDINATGRLTVGALSSAAQSQVLNSEIEVGGRNLLSDTRAFGRIDTTGWSIIGNTLTLTTETYKDLTVKEYPSTTLSSDTKVIVQYGLSESKATEVIQLGATYVCSFYAKGSGSFRTYFYLNNPPVASWIASDGTTGTDTDGAKIWTLTTEWKRYWIAYTLSSTGTPGVKRLLFRHDYNACATLSAKLCGLKLEKGNKPTDWTPAPEDVEAGIDDAAKTATSYIVADGTGLMVANMVGSEGQVTPSGITSGYNTLITPTSFSVRDGQTVLASYGSSIVIGQSTSRNVLIDGSNVSIRNGTTVVASYGDSITIGNNSNYKITIDTTNGLKIGSNVQIDTSGNASFSGSITSTSGTIGGWNIGSTYIDSTDSSKSTYVLLKNGVYNSSTNPNQDVLAVRNGTSGSYSYPFILRATGEFSVGGGKLYYNPTTSTLSVNGAVTATTGKIGVFNLNNSLYTSSNSFGTVANNIYIGSSGISLGTTFSVTAAGALTSTSGTIGGWTINEDGLTATNTFSGTTTTITLSSKTWAYLSVASPTSNTETQIGDYYVIVQGNSGSLSLFQNQMRIVNSSANDLFSVSNAGIVTAASEIRSNAPLSNGGNFRAISGNYGTIFRNDSSNFYILLTDSGNATGTWNSLRPLTISLSTGAVSSDSNWDVYSSANKTFNIRSTGGTADLNITTASSREARITVNNGVHAGKFQASSGNNLGIYDNTHSKWVVYSNSSGTVVVNTSDKRAKNYLQDTTQESAIDLLRSIKVRQFTYKDDEHGVVTNGIFAQDIRDYLISKNMGYRSYLNIQGANEDEEVYYDLTVDENKVQYGLEYQKFVPELWLGWQYHDDKLATHDTEIDKLKKRITTLELLLVKNNITFD